MQEDKTAPRSECSQCREGIDDVVTLTMADDGVQLLPDDPVIFVGHPEAPGPMHKRCAMAWIKLQPKAQFRVTFRLTSNVVKQGGVRMYFPPDTAVKRVDDEDRDSFRTALESESERGCALVAASFLDHVLGELLKAHFRNKSTGADLVDGYNSPLGTFSARIDAVCALGLVTTAEYKQLGIIRRIRNDFAHEFVHVSFESESVKDRVSELPLQPLSIRSGHHVLRERFESAVDVLLMNLRFRTEEWSMSDDSVDELPCMMPIDECGVVALKDEIVLACELRDPWLMALGAIQSADGDRA